MDTCTGRLVHADPAVVFQLAARVEDWPLILPHYRWVRVLDGHGSKRRTVSMAARRDVIAGFAFPLRWTAIETVCERERRIQFDHVRGITRGMHVVWTMEPGGSALEVEIRHVFEPRWPVPDGLVRLIVGEYFVNGVARRTLRCIADLAEARAARKQA